MENEMFNLKKDSGSNSVFRNRPRALAADELMTIAGGEWTRPKDTISKKSPYDMDYATRTFG
ncbi:hypothetical protein ATE67_19440 [Sphingopyxis sp. H050]|nr:hypothetical protein ATE76_20345 [Sphingopyxis sp. H093]KTE12090.1 hypothetical protein ATE71_10970 [Sphingopyxis sp. H115]KTE18141.1 hypothetical protein ATE67_19440 [Sphingopyxis sp. H050]